METNSHMKLAATIQQISNEHKQVVLVNAMKIALTKASTGSYIQLNVPDVHSKASSIITCIIKKSKPFDELAKDIEDFIRSLGNHEDAVVNTIYDDVIAYLHTEVDK